MNYQNAADGVAPIANKLVAFLGQLNHPRFLPITFDRSDQPVTIPDREWMNFR